MTLNSGNVAGWSHGCHPTEKLRHRSWRPSRFPRHHPRAGTRCRSSHRPRRQKSLNFHRQTTICCKRTGLICEFTGLVKSVNSAIALPLLWSGPGFSAQKSADARVAAQAIITQSARLISSAIAKVRLKLVCRLLEIQQGNRRNVPPGKQAHCATKHPCQTAQFYREEYQRSRNRSQTVSTRGEIEFQARPNTDAMDTPSRHISTNPPPSGR